MEAHQRFIQNSSLAVLMSSTECGETGGAPLKASCFTPVPSGFILKISGSLRNIALLRLVRPSVFCVDTSDYLSLDLGRIRLSLRAK